MGQVPDIMQSLPWLACPKDLGVVASCSSSVSLALSQVTHSPAVVAVVDVVVVLFVVVFVVVAVVFVVVLVVVAMAFAMATPGLAERGGGSSGPSGDMG